MGELGKLLNHFAAPGRSESLELSLGRWHNIQCLHVVRVLLEQLALHLPDLTNIIEGLV